MAEDEIQAQHAITQAAVNHPLQLYFNHFVNNIGVGDITTLLLRNSVPVGVLHMSPTTAKTFAKFLTEAVATLEQQMGNTFLTGPELLSKITAEEATAPEAKDEK
jgi:hypothetical protein